jgi:hypothetical protein
LQTEGARKRRQLESDHVPILVSDFGRGVLVPACRVRKTPAPANGSYDHLRARSR